MLVMDIARSVARAAYHVMPSRPLTRATGPASSAAGRVFRRDGNHASRGHQNRRLPGRGGDAPQRTEEDPPVGREATGRGGDPERRSGIASGTGERYRDAAQVEAELLGIG